MAGRLFTIWVTSRSESCSVVSYSLQPHGLYSPWNSPGRNTGVGCLLLLQGIFLTQGLNSGVLYCRQILYQLSHKRSPEKSVWGRRKMHISGSFTSTSLGGSPVLDYSEGPAVGRAQTLIWPYSYVYLCTCLKYPWLPELRFFVCPFVYSINTESA